MGLSALAVCKCNTCEGMPLAGRQNGAACIHTLLQAKCNVSLSQAAHGVSDAVRLLAVRLQEQAPHKVGREGEGNLHQHPYAPSGHNKVLPKPPGRHTRRSINPHSRGDAALGGAGGGCWPEVVAAAAPIAAIPPTTIAAHQAARGHALACVHARPLVAPLAHARELVLLIHVILQRRQLLLRVRQRRDVQRVGRLLLLWLR